MANENDRWSILHRLAKNDTLRAVSKLLACQARVFAEREKWAQLNAYLSEYLHTNIAQVNPFQLSNSSSFYARLKAICEQQHEIVRLEESKLDQLKNEWMQCRTREKGFDKLHKQSQQVTYSKLQKMNQKKLDEWSSVSFGRNEL